jgi:hypothetical protein
MTELINKPASKSFEDLMGIEYLGVKGKAAIDKLLQERQGHIKEAFYHDDIGWIDVYWGDERSGLCHIIKRREEQGRNGVKFAREAADVLEKGTSFPHKNPNKFNIAYKGRLAVIAFELEKTETTALFNAFHTNKKRPKSR